MTFVPHPSVGAPDAESMTAQTNTQPVIVGVDGSASSVSALVHGARIAAALHAPLEAVSAWTIPVMLDPFSPDVDWSPKEQAQRALAESVAAAFLGDPPAGLQQRTIAGPAAKALIEESAHARMLVVGSRGLGGFARMLIGSVSAACAAHAACPVLVVRDAPATEG